MIHHNRHERPKRPQEIIRAISKTDEFLKTVAERREDGRLADGRAVGQAALVGAALVAAPRIVDRMKATKGAEQYERQKTGAERQLELMATIPGWLEAKKKLDQHNGYMSRKEKIQTLRPVVAFNKVVREMIDMEQYRTISEVKRFVGSTLLLAGYDEADINYAEQVTRRTLNGMRHEIAAESVLSSLPEVYGIDGGSEEDEFIGKDINVTYRGVEVGIDIKASQAAADEANQKAWKHHDTEYVAIWSGFTNREFGDDLLPSREQLDAKKAYYQAVMDQVVGYVPQQQGVAFSA